MSEKLTDNASVRLSHDELSAIDKLAGMDGVCRSEWLRDAVIEKLARYRTQYDCLAKVFGDATDTSNTSYSEIKKA